MMKKSQRTAKSQTIVKTLMIATESLLIKRRVRKDKKEDPTKKLKDLENDVYDEVVGPG